MGSPGCTSRISGWIRNSIVPLTFPGSCTAFSAAIYTDEETINKPNERWNQIEGILFGKNLNGKERLTEHYKLNNLIHIVENSDKEKIKSVRFYLDCGDDDFLYKGNSTFHILLRDLEIPHEFRIRDGAHNWSYWRSGLIEGLKFISESFHQK